MQQASEERLDLPSLSVRRPLLALVLNLLIIIVGFAAFFGIEVRELPNVDRPLITVIVTLPGGSPETIDAEVTRIVEGAVARVSGLKEIHSESEESSARIWAEFLPSVDLNSAASDVREAISRVQEELPERVEQILVFKADANANPIMRIAARSTTLPDDELTRVVETDIVPELISIDGVADVTLFGARKRQLHVVLDPLRLASFGLSVSDVAKVLRNAPFDIPTGSFHSTDQNLLVRMNASTVSTRAVEDIIVRGNTRLRDVARINFGPADATTYTHVDGNPVIGMAIIRQSESNTVAISDQARAELERIDRRLANVELTVISDDAEFIRGSIHEVLVTLAFTVVIVIGSIWLFLGNMRATLVPTVAIPVSLIGTLAIMWSLGYSINILTLMALVLATGLIVDDAIVVLENIQRQRSMGAKPAAAAVHGTRQVFFAVIATTAVLVAVFVPISFLPSTAGRLFREFGFVLAGAVMISAVVALTLVPAMAARILRDDPSEEADNAVTRFGSRLRNTYERGLNYSLRHPKIVLISAVVFSVVGAILFLAVPQELLPREDRGMVTVRLLGPDGVGINYTERLVLEIEEYVAPHVKSGVIERVFSVVGMPDPNIAAVTLPMADWGDRSMSQQDLIVQLRGLVNRIPGARVGISGPNSLDLGSVSGDELAIALTGNDYQEIFEAAKAFGRLVEDKVEYLTEPDISYQPTQPQLSIQLDRRRASELGVSLDEIRETLRAMIGGDDLIDLNIGDQAVPIMLETSTRDVNDPSDLVNLHVRTTNGELVPLSSVVTIKEEGVATELGRYVQRRAIEIDFKIEDGVALSRAIADIRALESQLPENIGMIMRGEAKALEETTDDLSLTYFIAAAIVFLVLVAQFESWTSALVIMISVPLGLAAAVLVLFVTGVSLNIYSQIGLVMLIGLMAKNGVLVVEFADQLRDRGFSVHDAIARSAMVRLRPIAMTTLATVVGALPLVLAFGPGSEARQSIGWVVFGGLGLSATFTLFFTPIMYLLVAPLSKPRAGAAQQLAEELAHAREVPETHESDDVQHRPT